MRNITFKQYRNIDLLIFSVMLIISEAITTIATNKWFYQQPVAISTTLVLVCIVMMRWNGFAAIHACLGGLVFCIASGANPKQYAIYMIGNCFILLSLLWFKAFKKEEIRKSVFKLILFAASSYIFLEVGRWIVSLFFGGKPSELIGFFISDLISLLFAGVILLFLRNMDGMIEDQKAYLFRLQREREEKQQENLSNGYGYED